MEASPPLPKNRPSPLTYLAVGLIVFLGLVATLRLDRADLRVPLYYTLRGDTFEHAMWLKTTVDHGWYLNNPRLGAPGAMDLHDYPLSDSVHFGLVRLLAQFSQNYGLIVNLFYLIGYPLAAWTSLFVLRQFDISPSVAAVAAVLYAFLPYHFLRGQGHILLSGYWAVPLMVLVLLWLWRGERPFSSWGKALTTILTCAIMPATGVYYAFFGAFLVAIAGVAAWSRSRPIRDSVLVIALIAGSLAAQIAPNLVYFSKHGRSPEVAKRTSWEAEHFGLKIHQLLMPTLGHRIAYLQKFGIHGIVAPGEYQKISMNAVNENETSSLGVIGVFGFFGLLMSLLWPSREDDLMVPLSRFTVACIILATTGGAGVVFSRLVYTQIRAYNRISVYIAFFALFAVALGLDQLRKRWATSSGRQTAFLCVLGLMLVFGILDQSPAAMIPNHEAELAAFSADAKFVGQIEAAVPEHPMIFQLPYVAFPESLPLGRMQDYDHLWGYFHSEKLAWSYGAMKGRETDLWIRETAAKPVPEMVESLRAKGFGGVTVDRFGYDDGGKAIEAELRRATGAEPMIGPDDRVAFFPIDRK